MIEIIGKSKEHIHLSAPKDTDLKILEDFTDNEYTICSSPFMCVQDADDDGKFIWTLERKS